MRIVKLNHFSPLQFYWLFPAAIMLYGLLGNPNTPEFVWWALLAALACGLPLAATHYDPLSFNSLWALIHSLYFPFAVILNLITTQPGVWELYLWEATPAAMLVMSTGMVGLALGTKITESLWPIKSKSLGSRLPDASMAEKEILVVSSVRILCLVSLIIPLALLQLATGTYYHVLASGALGFSEQNALSFGYMGYLEYIVCAGILLQLRSYFISGSRRDLILAIIVVLLPIWVFLPCGSRDRMFRISMYPLLVAMIGFPRQLSKKFLLSLAGVFMGILFFLLAVETYRGTIYYQFGKPDLTIAERSEIFLEAINNSITKIKNNYDLTLQLYGRRFSDYVMVGRITDVFPVDLKYRGLEDIEYWPIYLLPRPLRPSTNFDSRDSAALSEKIKLGQYSGSSPAMIIGDLYSRFSWLGVFGGMVLIGCILRGLDKRLGRFGLLETLLYGFILVPLAKMPHDSVLAFFLFLTRTMLIALLMVVIMKKFLKGKRRNGSFGYFPVLKKNPGKQILANPGGF
jgi:hypothetical protein